MLNSTGESTIDSSEEGNVQAFVEEGDLPLEGFRARNKVGDSIFTARDAPTRQSQLRTLLSVDSDVVSVPSSQDASHCLMPSIDEEEYPTKILNERNAGRFTLVVFVNSASGGGKGSLIYRHMIKLLGSSEHVFDLHQCQGTGIMPEDKLLPMATDPFVRVLVCGGDGTMGWILSAIDKVWKRILGPTVRVDDTEYRNCLPLAIMPLGTGNDLSRMFNWGGTYADRMRKLTMIERVKTATASKLDRWRCVIVPFEKLDDEAKGWVPAMLAEKQRKKGSIRNLMNVFSNDNILSYPLPSSPGNNSPTARERWFAAVNKIIALNRIMATTRRAEYQGLMTKEVFDGVFCNYVSFGFDARVAFAFHKEREEHPERFKSALKNKLKYLEKGFTEGGLLALTESRLPPPLKGKMRILFSTENGEMEEIDLPEDCRGVALLNIQSFAAGQCIAKKGECADGLIELVFMRNLTRALGAALVPCARIPVAAQTDRVCIRINEPVHCEVDGEPWLQSEGIFQISYFGRSPILRNEASRFNCSLCDSADGV